jgi:hypothetical protein
MMETDENNNLSKIIVNSGDQSLKKLDCKLPQTPNKTTYKPA